MLDKTKNSLWIEKYSPTTTEDIICNKTAIHSIKNWLSNFDKIKKELNKNGLKDITKKKIKTESNSNAKSCMIITGNHGVGKTVSIKVILKDFKYDVQTIDFHTFKNGKNVKDTIKKIMNSTNIINIINKENAKKMAIVVDEIESITSTTEKNCLLSLQKSNEQNWFCPIIFISNNQHNKLLSEIKKNSFEVRFFPPFDSDLKKILIKVAQNEKIKIRNEKAIDKILNHSQADIRRLIYTLQDIKYAFKDEPLTLEMIEQYCDMSKKKDIDVDLFKATEGLLYNYKSINDCLRFYETEKVLLPLMVHQNYAKSVLLNYASQKDRYDIIKKVSESLSTGDVVENYIYGDQNWDMQEIHGYHTCVATSFYLCNGIKEKDIKKTPLSFTTDLNKTSIKKINKKNINNTNKCFNDLNIFDYIYMNKIIRNLINNGEIKRCVDILKNYNIKLEHIESLLKIDKIKSTKTSLTSKQKKEFTKYLT